MEQIDGKEIEFLPNISFLNIFTTVTFHYSTYNVSLSRKSLENSLDWIPRLTNAYKILGPNLVTTAQLTMFMFFLPIVAHYCANFQKHCWIRFCEQSIQAFRPQNWDKK